MTRLALSTCLVACLLLTAPQCLAQCSGGSCALPGRPTVRVFTNARMATVRTTTSNRRLFSRPLQVDRPLWLFDRPVFRGGLFARRNDRG